MSCVRISLLFCTLVPAWLTGCGAKITPVAGGTGGAAGGGGSGGSGAGAGTSPAPSPPASGMGTGGGAPAAPIPVPQPPPPDPRCGKGIDDVGCACDTKGATQPCCGTGTQTCAGDTEFQRWDVCRDCRGIAIMCTSPKEFAAGCDAGAAPPGDGPVGCECKPTTVRWCDEGIAGTEWSRQTCDAAGHWGPCLADNPLQNCKGGYDTACCTKHGYCCQDGRNGPFLDNGNGACVAIKC